MPLTWTATLATGVRQIDLQHQELIEIINELEAAHVSGRQAEALGEVLPRLSAYVLFHFATEEALLPAMAACAHAEKHRQQHKEFADKVAALNAHPVAAADLETLIAYLKCWLVEHIMKTDQDLARQIVRR